LTCCHLTESCVTVRGISPVTVSFILNLYRAPRTASTMELQSPWIRLTSSLIVVYVLTYTEAAAFDKCSFQCMRDVIQCRRTGGADCCQQYEDCYVACHPDSTSGGLPCNDKRGSWNKREDNDNWLSLGDTERSLNRRTGDRRLDRRMMTGLSNRGLDRRSMITGISSRSLDRRMMTGLNSRGVDRRNVGSSMSRVLNRPIIRGVDFKDVMDLVRHIY